MEGLEGKDYAADLLALKAANDALRERGKTWLLETLERLCAEVGTPASGAPGQSALQVGRQEWEFKVENSVMVGERMGIRYRGRTLLLEIGWPRLPEHGFVPKQGLARARVSLSQNVMVEPKTVDELILKRSDGEQVEWYGITEQSPARLISEVELRGYLGLLLAD